MDGTYSWLWMIFGLILSLGVFLVVAIAGLKRLAIYAINAAAEVQRAWDEVHPKAEMPVQDVK